MSNIIAFEPVRQQSRAQNLTTLMAGLAHERRRPDDVFWLKENAELLGVLAATKTELSSSNLATYTEFYEQIDERLRFYPQYYRFFLSICLDLEDLGFDGSKGSDLCRWVAQSGLPEAELSDLQRAEACRLLARRSARVPIADSALGARLRDFSERAATFALPNKKAAYELTHIVFYLSEYGQRDPGLGPDALISLEFAGLLAYLDQNHDLLAEVCTALHFAKAPVSPIWTDAVAQAHRQIVPMAGPQDTGHDAFHAYLVTGWAQAVRGAASFEHEVPKGPFHFATAPQPASALRPLSECLYDLGAARSGDWSGMRGRVLPYLDSSCQSILQRAEESTSKFDAFFEGFARANATRLSEVG